MTIRHTLTRWIAPALLAAAGLAAAPAQATDIGVSIGFSQPGVYGRVDIGRYPQPVLVAPRPVYVGRPVYREPVYLWVPPRPPPRLAPSLPPVRCLRCTGLFRAGPLVSAACRRAPRPRMAPRRPSWAPPRPWP